MNSLTIHPAAELFPSMTDEEFGGLVDDIQEHGQREAIVLWNGQLVDGRNRLRACEQLGLEPAFAELDEDTDPIQWVLSCNLHRRHLTASQRAMVAVKLKELLEPEAKERQRDGGRKAGNGRPAEKVAANLPQPKSPREKDTRDRAAEAVNVSGKLVDAADKVIKSGSDELKDAVTSGKVAVTKAAKIAELPAVEQPEAIAEAITSPRKTRTEKERIEEALSAFDQKVVVARVLFEQCLPGIRSAIHRSWGEWLEEARS